MAEKPEPGKEYIQPNEAGDTQEIVATIIANLTRQYAPGKTLRQFHAKMHGCVKANFKVNDDLPESYNYGFLQRGKTYDAWVRFSNGNANVLDDRKADLRGMAIKLLNVPGTMLEYDPVLSQSQDVLLVSYPTLMSATVKDFKANIKAICNGSLAMVSFALNPLHWGALVRTFQSFKKIDHLFAQEYFSVSPSMLGMENQAIKYSAVPQKKPVESPDKNNKNYLREVMQATLSTSDFVFDFRVQFQEDAVKMPIENPIAEWKSEWHNVATITILQQQFDNTAQDHFGGNLSFSPWHCLEENRPLGGISRARRAAYKAIAAFRIERNK